MNVYKVTYLEDGLRLDKALVIFCPEKSRSYLSSLISMGQCLVNGAPQKASFKVKEGDEITLDIPDPVELNVQKEDISLDVVYEDEDILIINKPQGMVVHPSVGHHEHTLVNAIMHHCTNLSGINGVIRPGIIHRIDKDTSGLICIAKNDKAHEFLAEQLKDHTMARTYVALVRGVIKEETGTINMPIGRDSKNRQKMAVVREGGKEAITHFKVLERYSTHTLIECSLVTGRTHQIRVHMSQIGYPVEGDPLYAGRNYDKLYQGGQLLTAVKLKLIHPRTKELMEFSVDIPQYFKDIIQKLKK